MILSRLERVAKPLVALVAACVIIVALWHLADAGSGLSVDPVTIEGMPATLYRPRSGAPAPVVVVAHGFAGSQQLMQAFATTFARNGYIALTFDFAGHGRNRAPLSGNVAREDGATRTLVEEARQIVAFGRGVGDGRTALLGHSMASDIVVRLAQSEPDISATIAVSMFSPAVTAESPRNLLVIAGGWEGAPAREVLRAVGLVSAPEPPQIGRTYGDVGRGTGRRAAISEGVEHVGVLYSVQSQREALDWLDHAFGRTPTASPYLDRRGPWIVALLAGIVLLAWPAARLLPVVADRPVGAGLGWRRLWLPLALPAIATPLILRVVPIHILPVPVGEYLVAHFALYGLLTAACLAWVGRRSQKAPPVTAARISRPALAGAALAATAYGFVGLVWPIDTYVTSFVAGGLRSVLVLAMLVGTLGYVLTDEWLTRGEGAARGAYAASKLALLLSLAVAISLDLPRLFFLIIIVPEIVVFFIVYGLFSRWAYGRTRHPFAAGVANAVAFAWAIGVTFPVLAP